MIPLPLGTDALRLPVSNDEEERFYDERDETPDHPQHHLHGLTVGCHRAAHSEGSTPR